MEFEPLGGFPPIVRTTDTKIQEKTLESRGFATNIVSIGNIMDAKRKEDFFTAFGSEDEEGANYLIEEIIQRNPTDYIFSEKESEKRSKNK